MNRPVIQASEEQMAIFALFVIAVVAIFVLEVNAKEIVIAIGSGLIGYLKGKGTAN
jgi:hypothetical protein